MVQAQHILGCESRGEVRLDKPDYSHPAKPGLITGGPADGSGLRNVLNCANAFARNLR